MSGHGCVVEWRQYTRMNTLQKNIRHLMGDLSINALAQKSGVTQPTLSRGLKAETWSPDLETVDKLAKVFRVTPDELRFVDFEATQADGNASAPRQQKSDVVHIPMLDGFELPKGGLLDRHSPFEHPIEVSEAWFRFNIAGEPKDVRYAVQRDDSLHGEVNMGDILFINTAATDLAIEGEGVYAFTLYRLNQIKHVQLQGDGSYLITGTRKSTSSILLQGNEVEGLTIRGRVVARWPLIRLL